MVASITTLMLQFGRWHASGYTLAEANDPDELDIPLAVQTKVDGPLKLTWPVKLRSACLLVSLLSLLITAYALLASHSAPTDSDSLSLATSHLSVLRQPLLSRVLLMFVCGSQAEVDYYAAAVPPHLADLAFYCWGSTPCSMQKARYAQSNLSALSGNTHRPDASQLYVSPWTSENQHVTMKNGRVRPFNRRRNILLAPWPLLTATEQRHGHIDIETTLPAFSPQTDHSQLEYEYPASIAEEFYLVRPRLLVFNEVELGVRLTWTSSRNYLLSQAKLMEREQGWRYAYLNFQDGDVRLQCPDVQQWLNESRTATSQPPLPLSEPFVPQLLHWSEWLQPAIDRRAAASPLLAEVSESVCYTGHIAFLLTAAPAIGTFRNVFSTWYQPYYSAVSSYHFDALFNGFHADAVDLLLPYCSRYDNITWWASQAAVIVRATCVLGHVLQFNAITRNATASTHISYPHGGDAFGLVGEIGLLPTSWSALHAALQQQLSVGAAQLLGPAILNTYGGWRADMAPQECVEHTQYRSRCN